MRKPLNYYMKKLIKRKKIYVVSGTGKGLTDISAFDAALTNAGIANYNLIYLSSIIPERSIIKIKRLKPKEAEYGKKLYVVMARCNQDIFGKEAWAGLGWTRDKTGRGLFAEHRSESKETVIRLIRNSLKDMKKLRTYKYGRINYSITGIKCKNRPVCAVVAAVYQSEGWF